MPQNPDQEQAESVDQNLPPHAGEENTMASGRMRQTTEPPRNAPSSPDSDRATQLNKNTGTNASAEELKDRIDEAATDTEQGSGEGDPDPVTHKNVQDTHDEAQGRPRGGSRER